MTASEFVVALDIGSHRTRCLIAEINADGVNVVGKGDELSRGVRRGEVIDLAAARFIVGKAVEAAELQAGVEVQSLFLATGSRHVGFFNNRACIGITREEHTITPRDMQQAQANARRVPVRDDALVIGTLVCSYAVDDVRHVREPQGMHGTRLEAEVHVITDARSTVENMTSCVDPKRHEVEEHVFSAHAAGEGVLDEDEKKLGVAVVDIGAGTTRIMLYRDHAPVFSSVVPVGGDHITNDIAMGMEIGLADAARLKEEHGTLDLARASHAITFEGVTKPGLFCVEPRRLYSIVDCRIREILDIVRRELMRAGVRPATVRTVLTGGTSRLPGLEPLAATLLGCPVRLGRPSLGDGSPTLGPDMATAIGALRVGVRARRRQTPLAAAGNPAGKLLSWLRQLF